MSNTVRLNESVFDGTVRVTQMAPGRGWLLWSMMGSSAIGGMLPMIYAYWLLGPSWTDSGWWIWLAVAVGLILFFGGFLLPFAVVERFWPSREFNMRALLCIDDSGLSVAGFAELPWSEVLGFEGIPDSEIQS